MGEIKEIDQVENGKNRNFFRGRRVNDGKWIYGYYWIVEEHWLDTNKNNKHFIKSKNNGIDYEIDKSTLGQYTGCEDKNGKPIFEGDIVRMHGWWYASGPAGYEQDITTVRYCHDVCGFTPMCNYDCDCGVYHDADECEVIGNIYDNPELLEVE